MSRARIESRTSHVGGRPSASLRATGAGYTSMASDPRLMPVHVLRQLVAQRALLDDRIRVTVQELRGAGASWTVIGDVLGITRSAAQKRYGVDELPLCSSADTGD
jgi:hypothetical protein